MSTQINIDKYSSNPSGFLNRLYTQTNSSTPLDVELDTMVIDYETLSSADKKKIDDLINVFNN